MKALEGIKVLDFTHVQSGPTCTQLLAWFGADVIKVERPGVGDATRQQLVDVEGADSLYFTMLNHNKRSIELNSKNETGKEVLTSWPGSVGSPVACDEAACCATSLWPEDTHAVRAKKSQFVVVTKYIHE